MEALPGVKNPADGKIYPLGPKPEDFFGFSCQSGACSDYNPGSVNWTNVYVALYEMMRCEKRIANFVIRTCFHENGNFLPSAKGSGPNTSGFCSGEHRREENTGHSFFDHGMAAITGVSNETGASPMDTLLMGCMVALEVSGGPSMTAAVTNLQMGRCDKTVQKNDPPPQPSPEDPPGVLPGGEDQTEPFLNFWETHGFAPAEAAALLSTHTLVDGKSLNMHSFDMEFIHTFAQNWKALGFTCRERTSADSQNPINLIQFNGNEEIFGFTSDGGRLANQQIRIAYPLPIVPPKAEKRCICFDPQINSNATLGAGAWTFTINDCNVWLTCSQVLRGNVAGLSNYTQEYCKAFVTFSNAPTQFKTILTQAITKLLKPAILSPKAKVINYQNIKRNGTAAMAADQYGRLCNRDAKTPCVATKVQQCDTTPSPAHRTCDMSNMKTYFHCQAQAVLTNYNPTVSFVAPQSSCGSMMSKNVYPPFTLDFKDPPVAPIKSSYCDSMNRCIDYFEITASKAYVQVGTTGSPTEWFAYEGSIPGPTIMVCKGRQSVVRIANNITDGIRISTHLHGAGTLPPWDGWAEDDTDFGSAKYYRYPNNRAATLWYHDHDIHHTAHNAYHGERAMKMGVFRLLFDMCDIIKRYELRIVKLY